MKVSKEQVKENRLHIVKTAAALFRERGFDGVGVAELMSAAGFTHGGFYKHFASKADLMAEAVSCGFVQSADISAGLSRDAFNERYLCRQHRDAMGSGCVMSALSTDTARQPESVKALFADGIEKHLARLADESGAEGTTRADLMATLAQLVGAVVLSRACPDDSALADEILDVCRARILNKGNGEG